MHMAIESNNLEIVNVLLQQGVDLTMLATEVSY